MNMGGYRKAVAGFTIVEVMIVLAVSGLMLVSAIVLISGRQGKTEFTTAINDLQQQLQQVINETTSGYFPNQGTYTCVGGSGAHAPTFSAASTPQGSNSGCIFLGKAIQFGLDSNSSVLGILPLVGNQSTSGTPVLNLAQAVPRAVYPASAGLSESSVPDASTADTMEYGLNVAPKGVTGCGTGQGGMCYTSTTGAGPFNIGAVAFVAGDKNGNLATPSGGSLQSGSQQFSLWAVNGSQPNESKANASLAIGNAGSATTTGLVAASNVTVCIASATTNQSGLFTISGNGSLSVSLKVMNGKAC